MAGLLDFIQGASNAAAGTVAGPVDLINMGLLGVGLPMPRNPVGGSQWMRERGLMREPQNRVAGLLGEAAGNVLPIVAAAKAPQIAQGLLNHADAYRKYHAATTAPGAPATVWHGSPHKFDKFDSSTIGTGSGVNAQGTGIYLSESKDVGAAYRGSDGALYQVDLPDEAAARMLNWQERIGLQPREVRAGVLRAIGPSQYRMNARYGATGSDIYNGALAGLPEDEAAALLARSGVPGVRYAGNGSTNFVVFPGNEGLLKILGRE